MNSAIPRILCVDDEPKNLSLLEAMLQPRGYDVVSAATGLEALEKIKTELIDICLLDIMMPGMDGFAVCRRIKDDSCHRNIPVVMITSLSDKANRIRGIESGADDFISKPFDRFEVFARIKRLLDVKLLNDKLNATREYAGDIVDTVREPMVVLNSDLKILSANRSFYETFAVNPEDTIEQYLYDLGNGQWKIPALQILLEDILPNDTVINDYEVEHNFPGIGLKTILLNARQVLRENVGSYTILLAMEDITERKQAEKIIRDAKEFTRSTLDGLSAHICVLNTHGEIIATNLSWDFFGSKNCADEGTCGVGSSYLEVCRTTLEEEKDDVEEFRAGISAVLDGTLPEFIKEYPCSSPGRELWFNCRVNPFTLNGAVYAVISHENITERKQLEAQVREALEYAENIVETVRVPMVVLDTDLRIISANRSFYETFAVNPEDTIEQYLYDLGNGQWKIPALQTLLEDILPNDTVINGYEVEHDFPGIGRKTIMLNAREIFRKTLGSHIILLAMEDITERKRMENVLEEYNRKLEIMSVTDSLTQIANRRHFDEILTQEHSRHARSGAELSLIMLDIDYFKAFNDNYGHINGDECLKQIARVLTDCTGRPADLAARYGGEEFVCILPETDSNGAVAIAEKILHGIRSSAIPHKTSKIAEYVTASLGVATARCAAEGSGLDIVAQADRLLYQAKSSGRNRLEFNYSSPC